MLASLCILATEAAAACPTSSPRIESPGTQLLANYSDPFISFSGFEPGNVVGGWARISNIPTLVHFDVRIDAAGGATIQVGIGDVPVGGTVEVWTDLGGGLQSNHLFFTVVGSAPRVRPRLIANPSCSPVPDFVAISAGFTPGGVIAIHEIFPNGSEVVRSNFSALADGTSRSGSFFFSGPGNYVAWFVDSTTGLSSNHVTFNLSTATATGLQMPTSSLSPHHGWPSMR